MKGTIRRVLAELLENLDDSKLVAASVMCASYPLCAKKGGMKIFVSLGSAQVLMIQ